MPSELGLVRLRVAVVVTAGLIGCATGPVKRVRIEALGSEAVEGVSVSRPEGTDSAVADHLQRGLQQGLSTHGLGPSASSLRLRTTILEAHGPGASGNAIDKAGGVVGAVLGSDFLKGKNATVLDADLRLELADGRPVGTALLRGVANDPLEPMAEAWGREAGQRLGAMIDRRKRQYARREAGDDRLVLTPTALQLEGGDVQVSDDEILFVRLALGVTDWLQLNLGGGGLALPVPAGALAGGGLVGGVDFGVKLRVLEESRNVPGIAIGYDLIDFFAAGWAVIFLGKGALPVAAGANVAFNLVSAVAEKHLPATGTSVSAGAYYLSTNQTIPAGVVISILVASGASANERKLQGILGFIGARQHLWRWLSLAGEWLPGRFGDQGIVSGIVRGVFHPRGRWLFLDASAIQVKLDAGAIAFYYPRPPSAGAAPAPAAKTDVLVLPWLSLGLFWM